MKKPKTLERFYAKAEEYIDVEDDPSYAMDIAEGSKDPSKKENDVPNSQKNSGGQKRGNDAKDNQNNKKLRFSKIQNPLENVFLAAKDTKDYPQPKPLKVNDSNISSGRFCRFHNQPGHNTNECRHLKSLVEELIRKNRLQQYVRNPQNALAVQGQNTPNDQYGSGERAQAPVNPRPIINTISGGPHPAEGSWRDMKKIC